MKVVQTALLNLMQQPRCVLKSPSRRSPDRVQMPAFSIDIGAEPRFGTVAGFTTNAAHIHHVPRTEI